MFNNLLIIRKYDMETRNEYNPRPEDLGLGVEDEQKALSSRSEGEESDEADEESFNSLINPDHIYSKAYWLLSLVLMKETKESFLVLEGVSPTNDQHYRQQYFIEFDKTRKYFSDKSVSLVGQELTFERYYCHSIQIGFNAAADLIQNLEQEKNVGYLKTIKEGKYNLSGLQELQPIKLAFFTITAENTFHKSSTRFNWCYQVLNGCLQADSKVQGVIGMEAFKLMSKYCEGKPAAPIPKQ